MPAILKYRIQSSNYGDLAISAGTTIGKLRETLSTVGYDVSDCYARLWRGVNQDQVYIGHLDNIELDHYDSLCFYKSNFSVTVEFNGAMSLTAEKKEETKDNAADKTASNKKRLKDVLNHLDAAAQIIINNL